MHALVSGAAGFVGRWLTRALREEGIAVTGLALPDDTTARHDTPLATSGGVPTSFAAAPPMVWCYGDLRDDAFVARTIDSARPDFVVHLAAISHVPTATSDPALAWDVNVTASARLLHHIERARSAGVIDPIVLFVGSAEQYGRQDGVPRALSEDTVQLPRSVYAATKAAQEVLALQSWRATNLKVLVARSFNHSGPGQDARFLLPALVARAVALRDAPTGTPLSVGNTTSIRDFLHVSDVVSAYISLLRQGTPGEAYNVASGEGRSVHHIIERVCERTAVHPTIVTDPALVRPVDVPALIGDPRKLQRATGWYAQRNFDDIIDDLIHAATH